jgi:phage-related protein (TIGR01555 family)
MAMEGDEESDEGLQTSVHMLDALIWGRLYGGCLIVIGADDGALDVSVPLDETRIRSVKWLKVIDRRFVWPQFSGGKRPEFYSLTPRHGGFNRVIHRSRVLVFGGAHTDEEERERLGGWDHSVLQALHDELRQFAGVWQAAEHLMADASQGVFKIQGLMEMIAGGQKEELQTRMELVDMCRSVARALLLDASEGEDFQRMPSSFTDAASLLDKFMLRLASAAEVPVTIFFGQSPAGMSATGESDFRWFYDTIATDQRNILLPKLRRVARLVMLAQDGPTGGQLPEAWEVLFEPLWEETPTERATNRKTVAETDALYVDRGIVLPEEVALSRFRPDGWNAETQIDRDLREQMLEAEGSNGDSADNSDKETEV